MMCDDGKRIDVDLMLQAYKNTPDWVPMVERSMLALIDFYLKHGLAHAPGVGPGEGRRYLLASEFTEKGILFDQTIARKWLASKGSKDNPPKMKLLEDGLARMGLQA